MFSLALAQSTQARRGAGCDTGWPHPKIDDVMAGWGGCERGGGGGGMRGGFSCEKNKYLKNNIQIFILFYKQKQNASLITRHRLQ